MKRMKMGVGVTAMVSIATLAMANVAVPPLAAAAPRAVSGPTEEELAAMSPVEQAVVLNPLRALANAVETAGRGADADIYTGVALLPTTHSVEVWTTEISAAGRLLADAKAIDPSIDASLARILPAGHTRVELDNRAAQIASTSATLPYRLNSMAVKQDGSGIELGVDNPATAQAQSRLQQPATKRNQILAATAAGVKITFTHEGRGHFYNGTANPDDDSIPFIAGDGISDGQWGCTLGVPAVRKSDGHPFILTAGHCYDVGETIITAGGSHVVGKVAKRTPTCTAKGQANCWDTEIIDAKNNADAAIGKVWHPIVSVAYSALGDFVCQDGYVSFTESYWGRCGTTVTNADWWQNMGTDSSPYWIRGVQGGNANGGATHGDSGGLVYTFVGTNNLQARGSVSGGADDNGHEWWWTESVDYLKYFGLKLNPQQ